FLTFVQSAIPAPPQDAASAVIEGAVFDRNDAVIQNVAISILDLKSHTVTSIRTDDRGRYSLTVKPGRYCVTQEPIVGWPIPNEHSSFFISAGERVVINFRPRWVFRITDSIEGGHWIEKYDTDDSMPSTIVHYIHQPAGAVRDLRVQYLSSRARKGVIAYSNSVTASFDRFTIYADDRVLYFPKKHKLTAQNVLFEDGKSARRARSVEIDLNTGSVLVNGARH